MLETAASAAGGDPREETRVQRVQTRGCRQAREGGFRTEGLGFPRLKGET